MEELPYDLGLRCFVVAGGSDEPLRHLLIKRGEEEFDIPIRFYRDGVAVELADAWTLTFVCKDKCGLGATTLALATLWDVTDGLYTAQLNTNGEALDTLCGDADSITIKGELTVSENGEAPKASRLLEVTIENDLWRGDEDAPTGLPDPDAKYLNYTIAQTLTGAQRLQKRTDLGLGRVFYTSETCVSDSTLTIAGAATGTDQTAKLQAILDQAVNGPIMVIWDGKYTTGRLRVRGNTYIKGLPGCGMILKNNANTTLLENYNMTLAVGTVAVGADANIILEGLTLNGNKANQSVSATTQDGWLVGLRMVGVRGIGLFGNTFLTCKTFCSQMANCERIICEANHIDTDSATMTQNQDGLHFHGPIRSCDVLNTSGFAADDIVSFVANDIGERGPDHGYNMLGALGQPYGDITDVTIDGLDLQFSNYGIRLLSSTSLMDRINISNVHGYTRYHHWLIVGANIPEYGNPTGRGSFGIISVSDCSATVPDAVSDECIQLDGRIGTIKFRNIMRQSASAPGGYATHVPTIRTEAGAVIGNLVFEDYTYDIKNERYYRSVPTYPGNGQIHIENNGHIGKLDVIRPSVTRHWSGPGDGVLIQNNGSIRLLCKSGIQGINLGDVVAGNAPEETVTGVADYLSSPTTVWADGDTNLYAETLEGGYMDDCWDPSSLYLYFPYSQHEHAVRDGDDGFGGNVKITARLQFVNLPDSGTLGIFCRATTASNSAVNSGYALLMYAPVGGNTVAFRLAYNGFSGDYIGGDHVISTSALIPYDVELNANVTTISAYARRSTDNFYLTAANTWSATRQPFATAVNTAHAAGAGLFNGIINWQNNPLIGAKRSVLDYTLSAAT